MELFVLAPLVLVVIAIIAFAIKKAGKNSGSSQSRGYSSGSRRTSSSSSDAGLLVLLGVLFLVAASPMIAAGKAGSGGKGSGLAWLILVAIIGAGLYFFLKK